MDRVIVFDTTLRDGEQAAGFSMNTMEKLEMARQLARLKGRLQDYSLRSATSGKDAIGEVAMKIDFDGTVVSGKGASTDVIEASARAYLSALNRIARSSSQRMKEVGP